MTVHSPRRIQGPSGPFVARSLVCEWIDLPIKANVKSGGVGLEKRRKVLTKHQKCRSIEIFRVASFVRCG